LSKEKHNAPEAKRVLQATKNLDPEVFADEGLTELPAGGDDVPRSGRAPVTGYDMERE